MYAGLRSLLVASILGVVLAPLAWAVEDGVTVDEAWARASIGTSRPAAAYVTLNNHSGHEMTLTGVSSSFSGDAAVHKTVKDRGMMEMVPAGPVAIPTGQQLVMKPGGHHIMLTNLKRALKKGGEVDLKLDFADGTSIEASAQILGPGARGPDE